MHFCIHIHLLTIWSVLAIVMLWPQTEARIFNACTKFSSPGNITHTDSTVITEGSRFFRNSHCSTLPSLEGPLTRSGYFELTSAMHTMCANNRVCKVLHRYAPRKQLKFQTKRCLLKGAMLPAGELRSDIQVHLHNSHS